MVGWLGKLVGGGVGELAGGVAKAIDTFVETEEEKKAAEILLMKVQQNPDKWQAEINKIEAGHRSIFVAGWRPFIGWVCGSGLALQFLVLPLFEWGCQLANKSIVPPSLDAGVIVSLVLAMLGLGATRTYEKKHNLTS